jgi:hypothetical protein
MEGQVNRPLEWLVADDLPGGFNRGCSLALGKPSIFEGSNLKM